MDVKGEGKKGSDGSWDVRQEDLTKKEARGRGRQGGNKAWEKGNKDEEEKLGRAA